MQKLAKKETKKNSKKMSFLTNNLSAKDTYARVNVPWKTQWKQLSYPSASVLAFTVQTYLTGLEATNPNFLLVNWQVDAAGRVVLFQFIDQTDFTP